MRNVKSAVFTLFLMVFLIYSPVSLNGNQKDPIDFQDFEKFVKQVMRDWKVPGLGIALVKDGRQIYAKGFGPTNNSLEAYLRVFESDFQVCTPQDSQQLAFLEDDGAMSKFRRPISNDIYTERGRRFFARRRLSVA